MVDSVLRIQVCESNHSARLGAGKEISVCL